MTIPSVSSKGSERNRSMGFWMATALVIGNVIGMGIFMLPASLAPFGFNALIGWVITLVGCVLIAQVFANFSRAFPNEDGPYGYTRRAFGNGVAFFIMWCYWISIWITNATVAVGVVGYFGSMTPQLASLPGFAPIAALCVIWFFVLISLYGARASGSVQIATTCLKLLPLFAVILLGIYLLLHDASVFTAQLPTTPISFQATTSAATIALFAMLGVESATIPAGKVHRPEWTIPRATMVGTILTAGIYLAVSAIPLLLLPQAELSKSSAPFVDLFQRYLSGDFGKVMALFVVISGLGALNGWTLVAGEMTLSLSRNGVFPPIFSRLNRYGAPQYALILTGLMASIMILMNYSKSLAQGFTMMSVISTAANLPLYFFGPLGLILLWKRGQIPMKSRSSKALVIGAFFAAVYTVWAFAGVGLESLLWIILLGAISLPLYVFKRFWQAKAK